MTGFGKCSLDSDDRKAVIEIKSLNSKQLDMNFKLPSLFKDKELELRNLLSARLQRGKIEIYLYYESYLTDQPTGINQLIIEKYHQQLEQLTRETGIPALADPLSVIMRLPDVLKQEKPELDEAEWKEVKNCFEKALDELDKFRVQEGKAMEEDFVSRIGMIRDHKEEISKLDVARLNKVKDRVKSNLELFIPLDKIDPNRFEQEVVYYLEKMDITEELVRLENHCAYFLETLQQEGPVGKKMNFIAQEMGREINTIGSKANDSNIQKLVVQMKDELEKIKEQGMNVL
jgi:uncharacterized protein (TIGR00255 family)